MFTVFAGKVGYEYLWNQVEPSNGDIFVTILFVYAVEYKSKFKIK